MKSIAILVSLILGLAGCTGKTLVSEQLPEEMNPQQTAPVVVQEEEPEPVTHTLRLTAIGDIMCHSWQYNEAYDSATDSYDFHHNYQDMKAYFDQADLVVGNMETVFAGTENGCSDFPTFNSPDAFAQAAKDGGVDLVTTANNHCMDQREAGLLRTLDVLDEVGLLHMGTYRSQAERNQVLFVEKNGIKLAFLSYTYGTNGIPVAQDYEVNLMDEALIRADIAKAKEGNPDFIIVMPHMGNEYETYPWEVFQDWANMMIDAGADIILASHPHVLQPMEVREVQQADGTTRQAFVIYSLGNFISSQTTPPRNASILLNLELEKTDGQQPLIREVSFVPIWTQFRNVAEEDHFIVRSVYQMLSLPEEELRATVRAKDITRLWEIHDETTAMYFGSPVPVEDMQDEYLFYSYPASVVAEQADVAA
ncbi:MAG TPA: CapA family protein [Firmicutes bacterium]|nr:CapA family protein [Bacillota bacterium]